VSTAFNLVGQFQRESRAYRGARVRTTYESHTLIYNLPPGDVSLKGKDFWEQQADKKAVALTCHSPFERCWMIDWQLVPVTHQEKSA
jgi:hypothetical protein